MRGSFIIDVGIASSIPFQKVQNETTLGGASARGTNGGRMLASHPLRQARAQRVSDTLQLRREVARDVQNEIRQVIRVVLVSREGISVNLAVRRARRHNRHIGGDHTIVGV